MAQKAELLQPVLAIWREVLGDGSPQLHTDSNFFLSGGDSLQLTRVLVRVAERLGVELDLRDVVRFSTPRKMADCCAAASLRSVAVSGPQADSRAAAVPGHFPCSEGQAALWLVEQSSRVAGLYNTAVIVHIAGDLQVPVLARALTLVVHRHEALRIRLRFDTQAQRLLACVMHMQENNVTLDVQSLRSGPAAQYLRELAAQPFDLAVGPLWRFGLATTGPHAWSLLLCVHHCVSDGWSGTVLSRHLTEAYNALLGNPCWQPHAIEREYRAFCLQQGFVPEAGLQWWRERLSGADRLDSWPRTGGRRWPFAMACEQLRVSGTPAAPGNGAGTTGIMPSALALAALRFALRDMTGLDELCIGMPASVRTNSAQEESVGYYVNVLVLRDRIDARMSELDVMEQNQRSITEALSQRAVPFPVLVKHLKPVLLPSGNPWCDILFAFQNLPQVPLQLSGLGTEVEALAMPYGQHPFKVEFIPVDGGWDCRIEYAREVVSQADVRSLLGALQTRLASLLVVASRNK